MFYSQFILAKKGPLGTIWIAAHLERKLRKNQVADTDIGVSVDSILSPEVPIALRLSSHLLLGVVRIYSRKVNYLFNDCSEALLKIKQAFRSTAVDLPPEESTAPYHSITLPETFDLDDFELPDSAFQGNFVDHHVSTREQITLQDSVDGLGYSTSQFGLDERFGDGDASQIRLDLDEDLFLDNNSSVQHASIQFGTADGMLHQDQPFIPPTSMDVDEGQEGCDRNTISETSKDLSELLSNDYEKTIGSTVGNIRKNDAFLRHGYNIQTPDLNEVFLPDNHIEGPSAILDYTACAAADAPTPDLYECAEAPSTPRLMEEAIPASVQEIPALSPQEKTHLSTAEPIDGGISTSPQLGIVNLDVTKNNDPTLVVKMDPEPVENAPNAVEAIDADTSTSSPIKLPSLAKEKSNSPIFGVRTDPESAASASDTLEAFGLHTSTCPKLNVVSFDMTENDETLSDMRMVTPAGNVKVVSSANSVLADPRLANVGPECSVEYLDGPDRSQLVCGQKSDDILNKGIICNKVDNLPVVLGSMKVILPEVTSCDGPVASSCFGEASNVETPLDKPTIHCVAAVGSHNNIVLPEIISDFNCCSVVNKSDQLIPGAQVQVETCSEFSRREPYGISEVNHLEKVHHDSGSFIKGQGIMPDISGSSFVTKADQLIRGDEAHMDDVVSCLISNTSAVSSSYFLKPCNSFSNQTNVLPSGPGKSVNTAPEFSHREPYRVSEEAHMGKVSHTSGSFVEVQGDNNRTSTAMETIQEMHQKLESVLPGFQPNVCRPDEQVNDPLSKVAQFDKLNCFSSSYPEPEKVLLAPTGGIKLLNDLRQPTAEKSAAESAGSFDRISSLSGRKRQLMDTTPVQQIGSSSKVLGVPRVGRNAAYVPADDDLLASILVGRTPELRLGATPPPTKIATRKRPRLMHKISVPKRKVLLDDTMVLHADAIRQQLMNTEDIRRVRKKAPCTRSEIWMIEKRFTEEEIFHESLSTGISASLTSLYCQTYNERPGFQVGGHHSDEYFSSVQLSKELEHSRSLEFVRERTGNEMGKTGTTMTNEVDGGPSITSAPGELDGQKNAIGLDGQKKLESCPPDLEPRDNQTGNLSTVDIGMVGTSVTSVSSEANIYNDAVELDMRENLESCPPQLEQPSISQAVTVSAIDIIAHEIPGFEMPSVSAMLYGNEHKIPADSVVEDTLLQGSNVAKSPPNKCHTICINQEQEPVLDLVQPSEKSSEMSEGAFNLIGDAPVEGTVSAKDAMECREVDRIALPSVNDGTQVQDACVTSDVLQQGIIGNHDPRRSHEDVGRIENGETLVSLLDRCLLKDAAGLPVNSAPVTHSNSSISPMAIENDELNELATAKGNQAMEENKDGDLGITLDGEDVVQRVLADEERHSSETTCSEKPESSCPHEVNIETENIPSTVGENSVMQESNLEGCLDVESAPMDLTARESSDFCSAVDGNDTEFLNVDDEADFDEEADDDVPNPEEAQSLENSGWSSRTRGVARYLKALFDGESGRGRKVVAMDHLLGGKTRREASRMFFETLVLKTKDYVHVEQEKPFDSISIKPRPKLLKSDF